MYLLEYIEHFTNNNDLDFRCIQKKKGFGETCVAALDKKYCLFKILRNFDLSKSHLLKFNLKDGLIIIGKSGKVDLGALVFPIINWHEIQA